MDNQKFFQIALERRSKRLVHLIDISAPPQLISNEVALIVQAAMGYCPEEMSKAMTNLQSGRYPTCKETSHAQAESQAQEIL